MANIDERYFKTSEIKGKNRIEDMLEEDENILLRLKPNRKAITMEAFLKGLPFVLVWLLFDIFFLWFMFSNHFFQNFPNVIYFVIPFFLIHLLVPIAIYVRRLVRSLAGYKNIEYVFTDRRIIIRSGLIGIDLKNIYYSSIEGINLRVGVIERICQVGDVYIKCLNQSAVLENLDEPYRYLAKLQKIAMEVKSDIYFPNSLRSKK